MPKMSGEECFKKLRVINPASKIIISTGYMYSNVNQLGIIEKGNPVIRKPYKIELLSKVLSEVLSKGENGK